MPEAKFHSKVYIQKTRQLYANISGNLAVGFCLALLLASIQTHVIDAFYAWSWLACLACVSASRLALLWHFNSHFDGSYDMAKSYEQRFYIGVIASALMWGGAGILLFPNAAMDHQVFLLLALVAISAGSIATLSSNFKHAVTFILLTMLPVEFNFISHVHSMAISESILCLIFVLLMIRTAFVLGKSSESILFNEAKTEAEAQIAAHQKNLFSSILENIPARISWKDKEQKYVGANRLFLQDFGFKSSASIIGQTDSDLGKLSPAQAKAEEDKELLIINQQSKHLQYEELKRNILSKEWWFEVNKAPILNEQNNVEGILTIYHDISKRKHAESMMRLAATAFETHEAVTITDPSGVILSVNKAFSEVTGFDENEVIGKTSRILSSGKHDMTFYSQMWQSLVCEGRWKGEVINRRKNGEEYTQQLTITAIVDDDEQVISYVGVFSDISEKKELEVQLRQAQKMEAVGTLVSGIAHEFNNMLVGISGNIFLSLDMIDKNNPAHQMLSTAEDICYKAADMIKQLLTFARKDNGNQKLQVVNMSTWINEGMKIAQSSIPASFQLNCHQNVGEDLFIKADTTQLHQIFINLLNNARDASEHLEHPEITVELSCGEADKDFRLRHNHWTAYQFVHLSVKDNGSGIPADKLDKIFEPFFTTKEVGKGTGLGMPVIQGLVAAHQGRISIESIEGQGTTVNLYFPRTTEVKTLPLLEEHLIIKGHGETILIADDEPEVLLVTATQLKNLGYNIIKASNGEEAVKLFCQQPEAIDLVLLDMVMPQLNGPAAAQQIRMIRREIPLIFQTGYSTNELVAELTDLDHYQFISKPYRTAEISQMIHKSLSGNRRI